MSLNKEEDQNFFMYQLIKNSLDLPHYPLALELIDSNNYIITIPI